MNRNHILEVIHAYISKYKMYKVPGWNKKKIFFKQESYARWAVKECLRLTLYSDDPLTAIEEFASMCDDNACCCRNGDMRYVFSVAYDVATDILCELGSLPGDGVGTFIRN